jgi:molecular chaperone DnaK
VLQGERPMAADNKTLGRFELADIPPAPRGVPQVEVTFDIDANGIVNVSAKDLGTGKEQSIRITASSGLSDSEVENLVKEAEAHAEEDKQKKKLIEVRNQADTLIYSTEKSIRDLGDKLDSVTKGDIETKTETLKKTMESDDAEAIERDMNELAQASHKLAEQLYAQKSEQGGPQAGAEGDQAGPEAGQQASGKDDEDVVDADYKEV